MLTSRILQADINPHVDAILAACGDVHQDDISAIHVYPKRIVIEGYTTGPDGVKTGRFRQEFDLEAHRVECHHGSLCGEPSACPPADTPSTPQAA